MKLRSVVFAILVGCGAPHSTPAVRPTIGAWGFDVAGMDRSVAPGEDFNRYANGGWRQRTPIPGDHASWTSFLAARGETAARVRTVIESAAGAEGSDERRIADCYRAYMDEAGIEARGLAPIQGRLDDIARIADRQGVIRQLAAMVRRDDNPPLQVWIAADDRDHGRHVAMIGQGGLQLPDREMYDEGVSQFARQRAAYRAFLVETLTRLGVGNAGPRAEAVYALEAQIARAHWTAVEERDFERRYNRRTLGELAGLAPGFDWTLWLHEVGLEHEAQVIALEPSAITAIAGLVVTAPVAVWRDYLTLRAVIAAGPLLPRRFADAHFAMFSQVLWGRQQQAPRWQRGVDAVDGALDQAIGRRYVERYLRPETKARARALVDNILAATDRRLTTVAWMAPETRARARRKLAALHVELAYPEHWRDYAGLRIAPDDPIGNAERAAEFGYQRGLARLGQPLDRGDWRISETAVDAFAMAGNTMYFAAGILQPPYFDPAADDAVNYGALGAFIGHEIGHNFDDRGAKYDWDGALRDWWQPKDRARFHATTAALSAQLATYCPIAATADEPAHCVDGALALSESLSDLAGLESAFDAYHHALAGRPAPVLEGFTGVQRFFLGFAQIYRGAYRNEALANLLRSDPHPPTTVRALIVRNVDAWYDAFHVQPGDALYLPPAQRIHIW